MDAVFTLINLAGLIALLLWGVHMVQSGLQRTFGPGLKTILGSALRNRVQAFATGVGITALLQSSTAVGLMTSGFVAFGIVSLSSALAVMLLVMSLAGQGVVPFETALALVLGANLGTAINPWLESRHGENPATLRLPIGNLINRTIAVVIAFPLLAWPAPLVLMVDEDKGRSVANFHTAFNLVNAIVVLPFLAPYEALLRRLMPDRPDKEDPGNPRYLDKAARSMPVMALANASREALRMVDVLQTMIAGTRSVLEDDVNSKGKVTEVKSLDDALDKLNASIKAYLTEIDHQQLTEADQKRLNEVFTFITNIEHAGDVIDRSILRQATKRIKRGVRFSPEGFAEIRGMMERLSWHLQAASTVFMTEDAEAARRLADEKARFRDMESSRLRAGRKETKATTSMHLDLVRDLKLVNAHLVAAAAYPILEGKGQLLSSRVADA